MNADIVIALVFFIIGLIPTYYFYKKSIRIKEPVYCIKSNNLISGSASTLQNLNISYKDHKVENLTVSKILFYNRGAETIKAEDLETINHLGISSQVCDILDGSILQVNNLSNNLRVHYHKDSKSVFINFDYLDQNQGAVIQVVHTGLSSNDINLLGDIKGVQKLEQVLPEKLEKKVPLPVRAKAILGVYVLVAIIGLYFIIFQRDFTMSLFRSYPWPIGVIALAVSALGGTLPVFIFLIIVGYIRSLFVPITMLPKGLEQFDE